MWTNILLRWKIAYRDSILVTLSEKITVYVYIDFIGCVLLFIALPFSFSPTHQVCTLSFKTAIFFLFSREVGHSVPVYGGVLAKCGGGQTNSIHMHCSTVALNLRVFLKLPWKRSPLRVNHPWMDSWGGTVYTGYVRTQTQIYQQTQLYKQHSTRL